MVPAISWTKARSRPTRALNNDDLPAFTAPTTLLFSLGAVVTLLCAIALHVFAEARIERMSAAFGRWHWAGQGLAIYLGLALLMLSQREDVTSRLFIYFQF